MRRNIKITNDRGYAHKNNNVDTFMNSVIDSALSMQSLICASEASGLGICPISMIRNIIEDIRVLCKLPNGVFPIAGLALGWPDEKSPVSIRMSQEIVIHNDHYNEDNLLNKINDYDNRVYDIAPIPKEKQRHVEIYGIAKKGTWSENTARQLSVPERNNFRQWLKAIGINLE
jgi:nitroreductase/FMN reductase [NAD(P)H]